LPVISTHFSNLSDFTGIVSINDDNQSFKNSIEREIETDSLEKKQQRVQFAEHNSWENRVDQFSDIITQLEEKKHK